MTGDTYGHTITSPADVDRAVRHTLLTSLKVSLEVLQASPLLAGAHLTPARIVALLAIVVGDLAADLIDAPPCGHD